MAQYKHRRLGTNLSQIRLLRIEKTQADQPITLSLRHTSLDDNELFNALSYAWGEDDKLYDIAIQDGDETGTFSVRPNLYHFLTTARNSRDTWASAWIWIDQVCIDQDHHEERCHQVAQMSRIYTMASATIVWPGHTSPQEQTLQPNAESSTPLFDGYDMEKIQLTPIKIEDWQPAPILPSVAAIRLLSTITRSMLGSIVSASYWTRLWIVQEVILASRVYVVISDCIWELNDFHLVIVSTIDHQDRFEPEMQRLVDWPLQKLQLWLGRVALGRESRTERPLGFSNWFHAFVLVRNTMCSIILDRIYGVMALVHKDLQVYPDYKISQQQLLRAILEKQFSFPIYDGHASWEISFTIIERWTSTLGFQPLESVRDMLDQISHDESRHAPINHTETKRHVVQLVIKELNLTRPTLVLSTDQRPWWTAATIVSYQAYVHGSDTNDHFPAAVGLHNREQAFEDAVSEVLSWVYLQECLIREAPSPNEKRLKTELPIDALAREVLLSMYGRKMEDQVSMFKTLFTQQDTNIDQDVARTLAHLPNPLIQCILVVIEFENIDGNYDPGLPLL